MSKHTAPTTNEAGETFEDWFAKVDRLLVARLGIGADDGADWPSWDTWADGATPADALYAWADYQDGLPDGLI